MGGRLKMRAGYKWEWAVFYERKDHKGKWVERKIMCESRRAARVHANDFKFSAKNGGPVRNIQIKRRLVQNHWYDY